MATSREGRYGDFPGSGDPGKTLGPRSAPPWHHHEVTGADALAFRALLPLLLVSGVVVLVTLGLGRGFWFANLHNALLALAFTWVGAYVLYQRPGHPTGALFMATGAVEAVMFLVEYASAGVHAAHPWQSTTPIPVARGWSAVARPTYAGLQVLWVVVVVARWRRADGHVRSQLLWLLGAAAISAATLGIGLLGWGTAEPGLLAAALVPLTAGWAIVHGQHLAAYSALTWLSRSGPHPQDLPHDLARTAAQALGASRATLWMGNASRLHAVGVWPETYDAVPPSDLESLGAGPGRHVRAVSRADSVIGALSVETTDRHDISLAEGSLLDELASQAALVLDRQTLAELVTSRQGTGDLPGLTAREQQVLRLMARGLSNAAICEELHLSIKTVEPLVSAIFNKLQLHPDGDSNRRVLAVLAYLRN